MNKKNTIKKYNEFLEIINRKQFLRNHLYTVYFREPIEEYSRIGILITKKNGNAVSRNKIKRQIRMILNNDYIEKLNKDIIIIVSKNYDKNDYSNNSILLLELLKKI